MYFLKNLSSAIMVILMSVLMSSAVWAEGKTHKVVIQVSDNNKMKMNIALNNIQNLKKHFKSQGDKVVIELVAFGPGMHIFRADTSPVKARLATMGMMPDVKFSACGNTHRKMSKKAGKEVQLVAEASKIPAGVVRIMELQGQGYAYVRP